MHVLITGASRGMGAALADAYATSGVRLSLISRNINGLKEIAQKCTQKGAWVDTYILDITETKNLETTISNILEKNSIDIVIANAGISYYLSNNDSLEPIEVTKELVNVNFNAAISTALSVIPSMQKKRKGHVVFISSIAAHYGLPLSPGYCASKAGLKAYGEALRGLLHQYRIRITIVCPGFVESAMSKKFPSNKPFMMSASKAAAIIKKGIKLNKAYISFPFLLNTGMKLLNILPSYICDFVLLKLGYTPIKSKKALPKD